MSAYTAARLMLTPAAAGLALATACALAARLWRCFDLVSHFRPQYVAAASALCIVALAARAYPAAAVLAAVALVHGWAVKDLWLGGGTAAAAGLPLRVASANALASNRTPETVVDFVRAADADLVVLVEAQGERWRKVLAAVGALYPHRAPDGRRDGAAPVVLCSRHPLPRDEVVRPPGDLRPYRVAEVAVGGRTLTAVAVHPAAPFPPCAASGTAASTRRGPRVDADPVRDAGSDPRSRMDRPVRRRCTSAYADLGAHPMRCRTWAGAGSRAAVERWGWRSRQRRRAAHSTHRRWPSTSASWPRR